MAAITTPAISLDEYLAHYLESGEKPAYEYVDGLLVRKAMPTREHSQVQMNVAFYLRLHYASRLNPLPELHARVAPTRFYVPDIAVEERNTPRQGRYPGPANPVFLCVEIKSPTDRIPTLWAKCVDYHAWGVPHCWVIDPERRLAWEYTPADEEPRRIADHLTAGDIQMPLASVFEGVASAS